MVNTKSIASFPLILLSYSTLMIWFASMLGAIFSKQFNLLKNFVNDIVQNNNFDDKYSFQIEEFDNLKDFIKEQIIEKKEAFAYKEKINSYILTTVHNVNSPIQALNNIMQSIKKFVPLENIYLYSETTKLIQDKFKDLLNYNKTIQKKFINTSYAIINNIVVSLVARKKIEYNNLEIRSNLLNSLVWGKFDSTELDNILSNVINNSIEARDPNRNLIITINLFVKNNYATIEIIDNGKGFNKELIPSIKSGTSFKKDGNGIAIKAANDYLLMNDAMLDIISQPGLGTTIKISFMVVNYSYLGKNMPGLGNEVWIVDEDPRFIIQWQQYLNNKKIKVRSFINLIDFEVSYNESNNKNELLIIMDYEFKSYKENGLLTLLNNKVINAIISSSNYTNFELQNKIKETQYKLFPKIFYKYFDI